MARPLRRPRGRARTLGASQDTPNPIWTDVGVTQNPGHRTPGLVQRRQQQVIGTHDRARLTRLLRRDVEQALGVGGVGQTLPAPGLAATAAGLEALPHASGVEPELRQHRLGGPARLQQGQQDVLGADGVMAQSLGLRPRFVERALNRGAQRAGVETGNGIGTQRGLASSMSMMGMPSSTA